MGKRGLFFTWIGVALLAAVSAESGKLKLKKQVLTIELFYNLKSLNTTKPCACQ